MFFLKKKKKVLIEEAKPDPFDELDFQIDKTAKFDKNKIVYKPCSKLTIGHTSIIEANLIFDKENACISIGDRTFIGNNTSILSYENIEIGNDVLMQYEKDKQGKYSPAKQKNIDFGGGVERTITVLDGLDDDSLHACATINDSNLLTVQLLNTTKESLEFNLQIDDQYAFIKMVPNSVQTVRIQL